MQHKREERREERCNELELHYRADTIVFPSHRERKKKRKEKRRRERKRRRKRKPWINSVSMRSIALTRKPIRGNIGFLNGGPPAWTVIPS